MTYDSVRREVFYNILMELVRLIKIFLNRQIEKSISVNICLMFSASGWSQIKGDYFIIIIFQLCFRTVQESQEEWNSGHNGFQYMLMII
jgi:hypothetical protein